MYFPQSSNFARHTKQEVAKVWAQESSSQESPSLESEQCDKIKECLSSFSLPLEHIPGWADQISEGQWRNVLLERLNGINCKSTFQNDANI